MRKRKLSKAAVRYLLLFVLITSTLFSAIPALATSSEESSNDEVHEDTPASLSETAPEIAAPPESEPVLPAAPESTNDNTAVPDPSVDAAPDTDTHEVPEASPDVPPELPSAQESENTQNSPMIPTFSGVNNTEAEEYTEFKLLENISAVCSDGVQMQVSVSGVICETDSSYVYDGSDRLILAAEGSVYRVEYTAVHPVTGEMYTAFRRITSVSAGHSPENSADNGTEGVEALSDRLQMFTLADLSDISYTVEMDTAHISTGYFDLECVNDKQGEVPHDQLSFGDISFIEGGELKGNVPPVVRNSSGHVHSYIKAHVNNVQVYYAGILHIIDGPASQDFIYYTTDSMISDKTVYAVLRENEKITLSYSHDVDYTISYEFKTADGTVTPDGPDGQTPDDIFTPERAIAAKKGQQVSVKVTIPRGYKAKLTAIKDDGTVLHEADMGQMLAYKHPEGNVNQIVFADGSPSELILQNKFVIPDMSGNVTISLQYEKIESFTFNAKLWTDTIFSKDRIVINKSEAPGENNCILSSTDHSFIWEFDGITAKSGNYWNTWEMDQMEINGEAVYVPTTTLADTTPYSKTTELSTGTQVKVTVESQGGQNARDGRRRYTVEISNCYEDLTISGGNMVSHHHKEYAMSVLDGVRNPGYFAPLDYYNSSSGGSDAPFWQTLEQDTLISQKGYKNSSWEYPFRFQREYGYYTADIAFTTKTGEALQVNGNIIKPTADGLPYIEYLIRTDSSADPAVKGEYTVVSFSQWQASADGYFYFRGTDNVRKFAESQDANGVVLISIHADPIKLAMDYQAGSDETGKTAPAAETIVNLPPRQKGGKSGYNVDTNTKILISNSVPVDRSNRFIFDHWEVMTVNVDDEHEYGYVSDIPKTDAEGKPVKVQQGSSYQITSDLLRPLHDCFFFEGTPKEDNSRAVLTLRAVWRERGSTPAISYAVRYILANARNGQIEDETQLVINEHSHTVNEGAMLVTDLYADENKTLSANLQRIISGKNDFKRDYTENGLYKWVVYEPRTTKVIESVSPENSIATVYLIRGNSLISAEKHWSSPDHSENLVNVALQRRTDDTSQWETVEQAQLSDANQWKHTFDVPTYYDINALKAYHYRVVELDENGTVTENG